MKNNKIKLVVFLIIVFIELIFFITGLIQTKGDSYHNTVFIFFTNVYVIYLGLIYLLNKINKE